MGCPNRPDRDSRRPFSQTIWRIQSQVLHVIDKSYGTSSVGSPRSFLSDRLLADVLFSLGFAIMFRSTIGVALVPAWWAGFLFVVLTEEESLERALGQPYLDYKQRVKGRIIPGLPI